MVSYLGFDAQPDVCRSDRDAAIMTLALELAARGPVPDPNPRVGAIIVNADGVIVGAGFHAGAGTPHAEALALAQAGPAAQGGTAYVTLEPCAHRGRTGPCTQALFQAGVARVVYAQADPNPVASGGHAWLTGRGVRVDGGCRAAEATELNRAWSVAVAAGRPHVTWKYAATLDGYSAAADGTSQWITGPLARADVHERRAACDAIMVGTGTALADDPRLTVRHPDGTVRERQPLRVVVGHRDLPAGARLLDQSAPTLQLRSREPDQVLADLHAREVRHVWLEGGPTLAAAFLRAGLVDEIVAYLAPTLLGAGRPAVGRLDVTTLAERRDVDVVDVAVVGTDVRVIARPLDRGSSRARPTEPLEAAITLNVRVSA